VTKGEILFSLLLDILILNLRHQANSDDVGFVTHLTQEQPNLEMDSTGWAMHSTSTSSICFNMNSVLECVSGAPGNNDQDCK
jgi:hypothetical protein